MPLGYTPEVGIPESSFLRGLSGCDLAALEPVDQLNWNLGRMVGLAFWVEVSILSVFHVPCLVVPPKVPDLVVRRIAVVVAGNLPGLR